ncbi:MAG: hypothetical protein WD801_08780 [Gemmatimonadaceae bacterium]
MTRRTPTELMDWERPSDRFLAYLGRLSAACIEGDREQLEKLLRMRLSSHLPRAVVDEMEFFRRARASSLRAPLRLMRYVHKMQQLATAPSDMTQTRLELREREAGAPLPPTRRRAVARRDPADHAE